MLNLSSEKYSSVYLGFREVTPWIVNQADMPIIAENAAFVRHAFQNKNRLNIYTQTFDQEITLPEILKYLGVASKGFKGIPFVGLSEYREWDEAADIILLAERFHFPGCYHIGAGRHVLLKSTHLKGIGRNILSINEDYSHSWGGLLIKDALKGYVTSRYVDQRTILPCLKIYGLFMYEDKDADGVPMAIALRDARSFRIAQAHPETLSEAEKQTIRTHLKNFFTDLGPHAMLDKIIENYIHAYSVGVRHKAPSPDNLLVDGRWIDSESLDINLSKEAFDEWISFKFSKDETDFNPAQFSTLRSISTKEDLLFHDSWIHQLFLMCQYSYRVYEGLFPELNYDLEGRFSFYLDKYLSHMDLDLWLKILNTFDKKSLPKIFKIEDFNIDQLKLRGYYFNPQITLHHLTFGASEVDSFDLMDKLTNRWEKAFWPMLKNWEAAFTVASQIEKMCGGR